MWHQYNQGLGVFFRAAALGSGLMWAFGRDWLGRGWLALRDPDLICWMAVPANDQVQAEGIAQSMERHPRTGLALTRAALPRLNWCDSCPWLGECPAGKEKAPGLSARG